MCLIYTIYGQLILIKHAAGIHNIYDGIHINLYTYMRIVARVYKMYNVLANPHFSKFHFHFRPTLFSFGPKGGA